MLWFFMLIFMIVLVRNVKALLQAYWKDWNAIKLLERTK